jgi:hypothetical protein
MKRSIRKIILGILVFGLAVSVAGIAMAADEVSITGTINADSQLVDSSGNSYDIADTEQGYEVMEMTGKKVSVKGTVMEEDGSKTISITSFEVVE